MQKTRNVLEKKQENMAKRQLTDKCIITNYQPMYTGDINIGQLLWINITETCV